MKMHVWIPVMTAILQIQYPHSALRLCSMVGAGLNEIIETFNVTSYSNMALI